MTKAAATMVQTSFSGDGAAVAFGAATPGGRDPDQPSDTDPPVGAFSADVLAKMSHQLRSPLAGITGLTRIMLIKAKTSQVDPAKLVQQLEMIQSAAHRSMATVERVLDAAKLELAAAAANLQLVDLCALVAETASAPTTLTEQPVTVVRPNPSQPVMVTTDPDLLSRLMRELIDNALRFADATDVRVRLSTDTGQVVIEVSDDGAGIADKDQVRIFEAFERAGGAAQQAPDGIGMGLYLARKMAHRLGADLSLSSQPGAGSTFTVTFTDPDGPPTPPVLRTAGRLSMATVLIVDDRPTNLVIAHETLDLRGHEIIEAADGQNALAIAKDRHPDVVVTDVMMPGIDGFQLVHELQSDPDTADIPVLFYTAHYSPQEARSLATTFGVSGVLSKAGDPLELLDAVDLAVHDHPPREAAATHTGPHVGEQHLYTVNAKLMEKIEALDESNARFAAMAQESPIGIVIGDLHGLATYVNPRLSDITRTSAADLLGQGWLRCLHVEDRHALHTGPGSSLDPVLTDRRFREQLVRADGHQYWLNVLIRAIRDSENRMTGFIAMIDDISDVIEADERRRAEEREREIEARRQVAARFDSLARLSGGVAHDFNNILGIILSYDEFARDAVLDASGTLLTDDSTQAIIGDLDKIQHAGERAARIAHQLLAFGGREVVTLTVVDVNTVISDVRDTITGTLGPRVSFTLQLDPTLRAVRIDPGQLGEILTNLTTNANEAMPDGGALSLETHNRDPNPDTRVHGLTAGDFIHIAVTDSGEGMTAEVARQAMEPFFTTRPRGQGTGLGLATAYGIVKQAGGELVIESESGHGTTIHLYLPATEQLTPPTERPSPAVASSGQTVLVADDEDGLRAIVTRILTVAGYHVLTAANGHEALTVANNHPGLIDVLVTDVVMPGMNGRELAEALQATRPGMPVLYMSGYAAPLMTEQGLLGPGITVLGKPFTKAELLSTLRGTLNISHRLTQ